MLAILQWIFSNELHELILMCSTLVLVLTTIAFVIVYYKKIFYAKKEYDEAKGVVGGIVLSFKRRQNEQDEKINSLTYDVEGIHSTTERLAEQNRKIEGKIGGLITSVKTAFMINKKLVEHIITMREEVTNLSKAQQNIQKQFTALDEKYQKIPETVKTIAPRDDAPPSVRLTETEDQVIQFLLAEGSKTAPEVEKRIGKTREHTARLMKKLWQEGFIERDTHRIPFVYRVTEKLKKSLEAQT